MTKQSLRQCLRDKRDTLSEQLVAQHSALIHHRLIQTSVYQSAQCIAFYIAIKSEVRTQPSIVQALGEGKKVGVPVMRSQGIMGFQAISDLSELKPAQYGLLAPIANTDQIITPQTFDLIIVPGIAFDRHGHRIGSGGGYYDRYLSHTRAIRIGLAYTFQITDSIPADPHDLKIDWLITENEAIQITKA